jgi:hypothetical protein
LKLQKKLKNEGRARQKQSLQAIESGIVQNGSKSGYESLANAASTHTTVVQGNNDFFGQKLPSFKSVEAICV